MISPNLNAKLGVVLAALLPLFGGCYESSSDLIGDRANAIQSVGSFFVRDNRVFELYSKDGVTRACEISRPSEVSQSCDAGWEIKVERTRTGNYIVQFRAEGDPNARYHYGLWMRSEPGRRAVDQPCVVWLGDGFIKRSLNRSMASGYPNFARALREIATEPLIDRGQLIRIASAYELFLSGQLYSEGWSTDQHICPQEYSRIRGNSVVIAGDSRHLPAFDAPSGN